MGAQLLDGRAVAQSRRGALEATIKDGLNKGWATPTLAVIMVGDDPASALYVQRKMEQCHLVGIQSLHHRLDAHMDETALLTLISALNDDPNIHGILVQLPLPEHINTHAIIRHIHPMKDVDGFHPSNMGALATGQPALRPCTPLGIMRLLEHYKISLKGLDAVVIGTSNIVGKPMALELLLAGCTVTACHRQTKDLTSKCQEADLLVVAAGQQDVVGPEAIKAGAIVVDVGIHRDENGEIRGDLDFEKAREIAAWITPVPGGIGPMTVCTLLENTVQCWTSAQS